jgi:integrase
MLVARTLKEYSVQLAVHIRNAISKLFNHAEALDCYPGKNPARGVECGELKHARRPTLTLTQTNRALTAMPSPYREMGWLAIETSMNAAELCGLRRCWANLSSEFKQTDGEILPPFTIAVRENWYQGKRGSLKTGKRRRLCPITEQLSAEIGRLIQDSPFQGDDKPVFCSNRGTPIDADNARSRIFAPLAKKLGFEIAWHAFRRAHSTFAGQIDGVSIEDRMRTMGHGDPGMTLYYSVDDIERRRPIPSKIRDRITAAKTVDHLVNQTTETVQ